MVIMMVLMYEALYAKNIQRTKLNNFGLYNVDQSRCGNVLYRVAQPLKDRQLCLVKLI